MQQLGPYRLGEELGRGGMGAVFRAQDQRDGRIVALKVLLNPRFTKLNLERFRREAMGLHRIEHPNLVRVLGFSMQPPCPYVAFEYVPGETLKARVEREGPLRWHVAARILRDVAAGVAVAHERKLVHRDIKPANVLLSEAGAKLADFGLVKDLDLDSLTQSGALLGTPAYMAPEQVDPEGSEQGPHTDVYGLAATLLFALTGEPPFSEQTLVATLFAIKEQRPPSARSLMPEVPAWVDTVCQRGLAKLAEDRYPSAEAFREALLRGPEPARPVGKFVTGISAGLALGLGALWLVPWATRQRPGPAEPTLASTEQVGEVEGPTPDESEPPRDEPPPTTPEAQPSAQDYLDTARAKLEQKHYDEALKDYDRAIELEPINAALYDERGALLIALDEVGHGLRDLTHALELEATPKRYTSRAAVYVQIDDLQRALRDFDRAVGLDASRQNLLNRGALKASLGRLEGALADYARALEVEPDDPLALERRVRLLIRMGRRQDALPDLDRLLEVAPTPALFRTRGVIKTDLKRHADAVEDLSRAIESRPDYVDAYRDRGSSYCLLGRLDEALADYDRAIELNPEDVQSYTYRAAVRLNSQRYDGALADMSRVIELAPSANAYLTRGICLFNLRRYEQALADFEQALQLEPTNHFHVLHRGMARANLGQHAEALEDYDRALELNQKAEAWAPRGRVKATLGRHAEALADFDRALELRPRSASIHADRAATHEQLGHPQEALRDYTRALELGLEPGRSEQVRARQATLLAQEPE